MYAWISSRPYADPETLTGGTSSLTLYSVKVLGQESSESSPTFYGQDLGWAGQKLQEFISTPGCGLMMSRLGMPELASTADLGRCPKSLNCCFVTQLCGA